MSSLLIDDLRREIVTGRVLAVVGAGVSFAAAAGTPAQKYASWTGLLRDGIDRCQEVGFPRVPDGWVERRRADLDSGDLDSLLGVAEQVASRLNAAPGEYGRWLRETVGALTAYDSSVLAAIHELGVAVATTNYDSLIEQVTGLPTVTWREGARVERVVRGDDPGVLHLHGHWPDPESVVLGIRSYERVLGDVHAQAMLRALRTTRTLLFIGCGAGLEDPNFGALLHWSREVFAGSEYRHFRLCLEKEVKPLTAVHPPEERLFLIPYGTGFGDLEAFLRGLRPSSPASTAIERAAIAPPATGGALATRLPALRNCFGREAPLAEVVASVLESPPRPIPLLGPPGVGKTTVAVAVLHDPRVAERFGTRRFFARCEGATGRDAMVATTGTAIGLETGPNMLERLFRELESGPALLVLDNAETPWDGEPLPVEELLAQLAGMSGLALVVTVRGEQRPAGPRWHEAIRLRPLPLDPARNAFLAVAGERHRGDPYLDHLIDAVEGLPIAIDLLAHEAEALPELSELWRRWESERSALLQRAGGLTRETNLEISVRLSLQSPRLGAAGLRLASILALLPDGLAPKDLDAVLPDEGGRGTAALRQTGLAVADSPRTRLLAPIREVLRRIQPPEAEDCRRLLAHYISLALLGHRVGWEGGRETAQRLGPEAGNLEAVIDLALEEDNPAPAIKAAVALADLHRVTGLGRPDSLRRATEAARKARNAELEADCFRTRAELAFSRSELDTAHSCYAEALNLYRGIDQKLGEADCILGLGRTAHHRSDHDQARHYYQEALTLYQRSGGVLGEANCIQSLGDIHLASSDHDAARKCYEDALPLYRRISDPIGEASCIFSLGELALGLLDYDTARACLDEALSLYHNGGSVLGEANCLMRLGELSLSLGDTSQAQQFLQQALELYEQIHQPHWIGQAHRNIAHLAANATDRLEHVEAARAAWTSIGRSDLVARLDQEFGAAEEPPPPPALTRL